MSRELVDQANDIIERLRVLDDGIANACAFRALLELSTLATRGTTAPA
jgi:hypothetical protein